MNANLTRCYELLGVRPGISSKELKAAYRDLAKVWHPDRFSHDPRLQTKAQQKLKEINEAYEQLVSGKAKRQPPPPTPQQRNEYSYQPRPAQQRVAHQGSKLQSVLIVIMIFSAGFFFTTRWLIRQQQQLNAASVNEQIPALEVEEAESTSDATSPNQSLKRGNRIDQEIASPDVELSTPQTVVPEERADTRTVVIDPETGMLARPECPLKSRTTYATGNEPQRYCTSHTAAWAASQRQKDSRLKTAAKRLASPGKWFEGKAKPGSSNGPEAKPE